MRIALARVAPRIVRIYTLRGFESVLAGSVQVSTGTKTSLSFQDGPVFTRVHRREGPAAPRGSRARTHGTTISQPTWPGVPDRLHPAHAGRAPGQQPFEILKDLVGYVSCEAKGLAYKFARFWALPSVRIVLSLAATGERQPVQRTRHQSHPIRRRARIHVAG